MRDDKLKGNAAAKRSKARKLVEKNPELAAGLADKINGIDKASFKARVELWSVEVKLSLPTAPIVESTAATEQEPAAQEPSQELEWDPKKNLIEAECAKEAAELAFSKAKRALGKTAGPPSSKSWQGYYLCHELSDEAQEQRFVELKLKQAAESAVRCAETDLDIASREVKIARSDLCREVETRVA